MEENCVQRVRSVAHNSRFCVKKLRIFLGSDKYTDFKCISI